MRNLLWLIPVFPLLGALVNGLWGNRKGWSKHATSRVALAGSGLALAAALAAIADWAMAVGVHGVQVNHLFTWIPAGEMTTADGFLTNLTIEAALRIDSLSAVMLFFVTLVGFLIHVYSTGYMHDEPATAYARYFAYLNLFMFAMLTLVLGANLLVLFVGWEGVGLCSYLLIGFYFEKDWCAAAGKKAFVVNRIGDFGFLLAIFLAFKAFGTVDIAGLQTAMAANPEAAAQWATPIALLLFVGAIGKSAQLPLYVWLPDAMAGPTPVSALIHAATMVTAGVYMVARTSFVYALSPTALLVVAVVGGVTAVFAATIGLAQNDIKKVLAYSTVSQLGYMFLGAGAGAFAAAIFHVFTHAFFKACLFLGSGSVIHACGGEQDMRKMGGLRHHMKATYWTFLVATLALAGIPVFAGFFSKDEILAKVFAAGAGNLHGYGTVYLVLWGLGVVGAFLTAFYMFRAVYMTFHGKFRGTHEQEHHLHESPGVMVWPLRILAAGSVVVGFVGVSKVLVFNWFDPNWFEHFLHPVAPAVEAAHHASLGVEWGLIALSVGVAVAGIWLARRFYFGAEAGAVPARFAAAWPRLYRTVANRYWVDEIYDATVVDGTMMLARGSWEVDARVVDGVVNGTALGTRGSAFASGLLDLHIVDGLVNKIADAYQWASVRLRRLQWGVVQGYALAMVVGFVLVLAAALWLGHAV
ncbi:MAG: NADH-quinone oxidoreductase subunit L [Thermoanaerobaculaceae bacterium]